MALVNFGNLTVKQVEEKHGFTMSDYDRKTLEDLRQDEVEIGGAEFHIFSEPMTLFMCGSGEVYYLILSILHKSNKDIEGVISAEWKGF